MSNWFQRMTRGILTTEKKEIPAYLWYKCPKCKKIVPRDEHTQNLGVCSCGYHSRITSVQYFEILFDKKEYTELHTNLYSADPLNFVDKKRYIDRLQAAYKKTNLKSAITNVVGKVDGLDLVVSSMNFEFIGGSMGSVVGEKISRAIDYCIENKMPYMIISRSGGARMMEAAFSLMQMAKTSAKLTQLADAGLPFISFMTDPTTGGVTASYAMLGDINIAEPGALIGFAGPRVIRQTIGKDLPEGFQSSEFLLEHGFLDYIVERKDLKKTIALQLKLFKN
jgi:acetyl-CoA carboxylase carboxyl transferase subunit beta